MSRWKVVSIVLILGLGIGCLVPAATFWWANKAQAHSSLNTLDLETYSKKVSSTEPITKQIYHFGLDGGVLSVIEGKPGEKGNVVVSGLSVESWPKEIMDMALKVEFYSLDEVQSFIDTATESLWLE
ncbi:hypothetical protein Desor_0920 [Desulfosporosinus orientis DSM 765]|uniref:Uncharacterized protein n=1 Tax=Desulfosporosinus orientis (strain ATCC 19365 / DSM 765 / NCIMB 8382 / VKM B-1628 / Singapore I) TaxID=768706 RepID=G7WCQ8_DESOD|nr:hypothetical protein [Desulfosporosinus orientis]AET66596.1 hypothetical protein Desor_0920 [Desulfosporosinus orientis DSM 765]